MLLRIEKVSKNFGGLKALYNVDLAIEKGVIFSLIGPNGSGKTTMFNLITGIYPCSEGQIYFDDTDITGQPADRICRVGIARTFQGIRIFKEMTVMENVLVGQHRHARGNVISIALYKSRQERELRAEAEGILEFLRIADLCDRLAAELPYGLQRKVEIARALASRPALLLLDEPAAGMNEQEREVLFQDIINIWKTGITVLLVEHEISLVFRISNQIAVLNFGVKIAQGTPSEVMGNVQVQKAYLGTGDSG